MVTFNILLLIHNVGESLFKKSLWIVLKQLGIVREILIWRLKKKQTNDLISLNLSFLIFLKMVLTTPYLFTRKW